jgi:hypothetical protein
MGPYIKRHDSSAIEDGWTIRDGDQEVIAHLDTETMADTLLLCLLGSFPVKCPNYRADVWLEESDG